MLRRLAISIALIAFLSPVVARTRPHYGGTLRMEMEGDPWQRPDGLARQLVLDGLTTVDTDGEVEPALAVEWESENNNHRWRFRLRPGVSFQDGSPLTSVAVVAGLNAACAATCPWTTLHAVGASVVFTSDGPMPNLPALLAGDEFRIALTIASDGSTPRTAIGTGPFQVTSFNNGVLALTAYESCWHGRPFADTIEIRIHRAVHDQWLDLSTGRADVVEVPAADLRTAHQQRLNVVASPPVDLLALEVASSGPLSNANLRASVALAIDRDALANVIFQKEGRATGSLLPQSLTGYGFLFPVTRDMNKAHELRSGLNTPALSMTVDGSGAMQLAAQRIVLNLREAGFNVQIASSASPDLILRKIPITVGEPAAVLERILRNTGSSQPITGDTPSAMYAAEHDFLDRHTLIPLVNLPRAYAISGRVRNFALTEAGSQDLANASVEQAP